MGHTSRDIPGKRRIRKEVTRRQLLRAGRKLFSEKGLYESRVEDLTDTAGIAKGTLYLYFRNKQELVLEVTAAGYDELRMRVQETLDRAGANREVARAITRAHLEFFAENPDLLRVFHQVRGILKFRSPEWDPLKTPLERHIRFLAEALGKAPVHARWSAARRRQLAIQIYGAISGITSVQFVLEPSIDLRGLLPVIQGSLTPFSAGRGPAQKRRISPSRR